MADSFQLKAIITGVDRLSPVLDGISRNVKKSTKGFKEKALVAGAFGTAWSLVFADTVKSAMDFESSMADVRKVVNFDRPEQFQQMSDDILNMSTQLPMAATEIAKIFEAGGQAGLAAKDLHQFATDAVKMGVAFDESAESAGQQMAQWRVSLGMTQEQVEALADQINYLGNTGPTTAAKITDTVTRIGVLGKTVGFTTAQVAALASTIEASGTESEVAATAIKKVFTTLSGAMSKSQMHELKLLHINPSKLAKDLQKDGKKALLKVFDSISKVSPDKQVKVLNKLFGQESIQAITPLLSNLDLLKENFDKVGDAIRYAGSMQKEYASRADTTANKLQLLQNQLQQIKIETGDALLPAISDGLEQAMPLLKEVSNFVKANPEIVKVAAAAGSGLVAMGGASIVATMVAAAGPVGLLLAGLVGAGVYIASHWKDIQKIIDSNNQDSDTYKKARKVADAYHYGKTTTTSPLVYDPFGFNRPRKIPDNRMGVIPTNMVNISNPMLAGKVSSLLTDLGAVAGRFPFALTSWRNTPGFDYSAPTGKDLLSGGKSLIDVHLRFDNVPAGMRVSEGKTNTPNVNVKTDTGYSRFSSQSLIRGSY